MPGKSGEAVLAFGSGIVVVCCLDVQRQRPNAAEIHSTNLTSIFLDFAMNGPDVGCEIALLTECSTTFIAFVHTDALVNRADVDLGKGGEGDDDLRKR